MNQTILLDITGILASVTIDKKELADWLEFDFSLFLTDKKDRPAITIDVKTSGHPPAMPRLVASTQTPYYVSYDDGPRRYVDYFGRALVMYDYEAEHGEIHSTDLPFAYERLFLLILSRAGEKLDRKGLHRVHALGATFDDKALLFLMPEHGGKSTLGLSLLGVPRFKFLSDDSPIIDHCGRVYPSPLRVGLRDEAAAKKIPAEYVRTFKRDGRDTKIVVKMSYFAPYVEMNPKPIKWIFIGQWINYDEPRIEKVSALAVFATLFRDCVFGLGLAQVIEYFLRSQRSDLFAKTGIAFKRIWAVSILLMRGKSRRFLLSKNPEKNRECLLKFLEQK
jgi:hypothetical protein